MNWLAILLLIAAMLLVGCVDNPPETSELGGNEIREAIEELEALPPSPSRDADIERLRSRLSR